MSRCFALQARISLAAGEKEQALKFAQAAANSAKGLHTGDSVSDAYLVGEQALLLGDTESSLGDGSAAKSAWSAGLAQLPAKAVEEPHQIAVHTGLLQRLGRSAEAEPLSMKLARMGYRDPTTLR
jgi:hypothetical protein